MDLLLGGRLALLKGLVGKPSREVVFFKFSLRLRNFSNKSPPQVIVDRYSRVAVSYELSRNFRFLRVLYNLNKKT
jgi:hypothetical protein